MSNNPTLFRIILLSTVECFSIQRSHLSAEYSPRNAVCTVVRSAVSCFRVLQELCGTRHCFARLVNFHARPNARPPWAPTRIKAEALTRLTNERECFIGVSRHRETEESTRPKIRCIRCFEAFGYGRYLLQVADCGPGGETPI